MAETQVTSIVVDKLGGDKEAGTNFICFDAIENVQENYTAKVTSHITEKGVDVSDHVYLANPTISFRGIITDATLMGDTSGTNYNNESKENLVEWLNTFDQRQEAARQKSEDGEQPATVVGYVAEEYYENAKRDIEAQIAKQQSAYQRYGNANQIIEDLANETAAAYVRSTQQLVIEGDPSIHENGYGTASANNMLNQESSNARTLKGYGLLLNIREVRQPIKLILRNSSIDNCVLTSLTIVRDPQSSGTLVADLVFEVVRVASTELGSEVLVSAPVIDEVKPKKKTAVPAKNTTEDVFTKFSLSGGTAR